MNTGIEPYNHTSNLFLLGFGGVVVLWRRFLRYFLVVIGLGGVTVLLIMSLGLGFGVDGRCFLFFFVFDVPSFLFFFDPVDDEMFKILSFSDSQHSLQSTGAPFWSSAVVVSKSFPHNEFRHVIVVIFGALVVARRHIHFEVGWGTSLLSLGWVNSCTI